MKLFLGVLLFFASFTLQAQDKAIDNRVIVGIEQDVLPYFLQGWIVSAWLGINKFKVRCAYAQSTIPALMASPGFTKDRVSAFGIGFEFHPMGDFKGWWIGPGIGHWTNALTTDQGIQHYHESFIFTLGGGYTFNITKWLYVSSWTAGHVRVSGNRPVDYGGGAVYQPWVVTPEVSVKIGVRFPFAKEKSSFKRKGGKLEKKPKKAVSKKGKKKHKNSDTDTFVNPRD